MSNLQTAIQQKGQGPTLNTVIMVEQTLQDMEGSMFTMADIKRALPRQVNHNTLKAILQYLEDSNKIAVTIKGISWIFNPNPFLREAILQSR